MRVGIHVWLTPVGFGLLAASVAVALVAFVVARLTLDSPLDLGWPDNDRRGRRSGSLWTPVLLLLGLMIGATFFAAGAGLLRVLGVRVVTSPRRPPAKRDR
jgi:uncharacterized membrane protein